MTEPEVPFYIVWRRRVTSYEKGPFRVYRIGPGKKLPSGWHGGMNDPDCIWNGHSYHEAVAVAKQANADVKMAEAIRAKLED